MYKNYIFDLDGTLLDTLEDLAVAVNHALKKMNYPVRTLDEVRSFIGNGVKMLIRRSVPSEVGEAECEKTLKLYNEYYFAHIADCTRPYDGIEELLNTLKENGCRLAVVSNKSDKLTQKVIKICFGDAFDAVAGQKEDVKPKPDPEAVYGVMEILGAEKGDTVFIGDSDIDVKTAHNAGLPCIGVTWGNRSREVLVENGADFIADSAAEILKY